MAKLIPLAPDSAGFKVLSRLYDLNGKATVAQLSEVLWAEFRSKNRFWQIATVPLMSRGLAGAPNAAGSLTITPEGRLLVEAYRRTITAPRVAPADTGALDPRHCRFGDTRPGALDYRDKPSLMSGQRVPFRSSSGGEES